MPITKFFPNLAVLILILSILCSCALSPQTVIITPLLEVQETGDGQGTRLAIEVRDRRQSNIIGYRGGIYDTAAISTEDDITGPVYDEISRVFNKLGFTVVKKGAPSDARIIIDLQQLNYSVQQKNIIWTVEIFAVINTDAVKGTKTVSNNLEDRYTKDFPKSPSTSDNDKLINEVVSGLLQRVIQDESLITFLSGK